MGGWIGPFPTKYVYPQISGRPLLDKIMKEVPMEKIKAYFPAGGESGTIRNWYPADPGEPAYIYAKNRDLKHEFRPQWLPDYQIRQNTAFQHFF